MTFWRHRQWLNAVHFCVEPCCSLIFQFKAWRCHDIIHLLQGIQETLDVVSRPVGKSGCSKGTKLQSKYWLRFQGPAVWAGSTSSAVGVHLLTRPSALSCVLLQNKWLGITEPTAIGFWEEGGGGWWGFDGNWWHTQPTWAGCLYPSCWILGRIHKLSVKL